MKVGDLVQLKKHYKNRNRWAIITRCPDWSSFCDITYTDTGEAVNAIKAGLIVFSNELLTNQNI